MVELAMIAPPRYPRLFLRPVCDRLSFSPPRGRDRPSGMATAAVAESIVARYTKLLPRFRRAARRLLQEIIMGVNDSSVTLPQTRARHGIGVKVNAESPNL